MITTENVKKSHFGDFLKKDAFKVKYVHILLMAVMATIFMVQFHTKGSTESFAQSLRTENAPRLPGFSETQARICTQREIDSTLAQLPPDHCTIDSKNRFGCSFHQATKCPIPTWIENHFAKYLSAPSGNEGQTTIYVGCNKGFDAINALRMTSGDSKYTKAAWKSAMAAHGVVDAGVCGQEDTIDFDLPSLNSMPAKNSRVFCIEPVPSTVNALTLSSQQLSWDNQLTVTGAAVSSSNGMVYFQDVRPGFEATSLQNNCEKFKETDPEAFNNECAEVEVYTLDHYAEMFVDVDDNQSRINMLAIDVEGFDFDVLMGGQSVLPRVEYLEFEYHNKGNWRKQNLLDAVTMLDEKFSFTCYWAGEDKLWQITGCWLEHYSYHVWSNVACVNRVLMPELAAEMDAIYMRTLEG